MNATITWYEDRKTGKGMLLCECEDGTEERIEYDGEPIHPGKVDSDHIASLFGFWDWVEQNDEYIHCGTNQPLSKLAGDR
jgi:hypothetical protein